MYFVYSAVDYKNGVIAPSAFPLQMLNSPVTHFHHMHPTPRYTYPKIDVFQMAILMLIATTGNNAQVSFLVHQVPCASATVWQYHGMYTQFSLHIWASEYTCWSIIANLLYN